MTPMALSISMRENQHSLFHGAIACNFDHYDQQQRDVVDERTYHRINCCDWTFVA
jgi:hypothetical protein